MSLSPEQLAQRVDGITATDIGAIVGCHPFRRPIDVWLEKTGRAKPFQESARSRWGERLEPIIREDYEDIHRVRVELPGTLRHPRDRWELATPDGIAFALSGTEPVNGLEIKVHGRDAVVFGGLVYGTPGTDEVPPHELCQCAWGMEVTGLPRWDLVAFLDGAPQEYRIDRDEELLAMLREAGERFLVDHVHGDREPPPDGSDSWNEWLRRRNPESRAAHDDFISIDTNPELRSSVEMLREERTRLSEIEQRIDKLTQELKAAIGDKAGLTWREFGRAKPSKISWRFSKGHARTDFKLAAMEMRTSAALAVDARQLGIARAMIEDASAREESSENPDPEYLAAVELAIARLDVMHATLEEIALGKPIERHTGWIDGPRPFYVPRHWPKSSTDNKKEER